jgi:hypothetical protein
MLHNLYLFISFLDVLCYLRYLCYGYHFINSLWVPTHVNVEIFEVHNTTSATMLSQVKILLDKTKLHTSIETF